MNAYFAWLFSKMYYTKLFSFRNKILWPTKSDLFIAGFIIDFISESKTDPAGQFLFAVYGM
jgi:hypothetical protein